jgi:electron transfer flavoprotein-quinone oxidoreductase
MKSPDAIVVGAGPAGTTAALRMAQKGLSVLLVERADVPGSKNMFGGMLPHCTVPDQLLPGFWDEAPWERHVVKRTLTVLSDGTATSMTFEADSFDHSPYNGYTLYRPVFDRWYAEKAKEAGAKLVTGCLVKGLLYDDRAVRGVTIGREQGNVKAPVVVACDGVLSLLGQGVGVVKQHQASHMALGIKALFSLPEEEINDRFGLVRRQGATSEFLGCTEGIRGGGFVYTQTGTMTAGLVFHLDSLREKGIAPYDLFAKFLERSQLRRLVKGARMIEYSAHVLPEGGYKGVPQLCADGLLLAGDAAGLCYTNGLNQEGMNLAMTSGFLAAETVIEAHEKGDFSRKQLHRYEDRLRESFVLCDMKTFEKTADLMHNDRLFGAYPRLVGRIMEELYRSDGTPKKGMGRVAWDAAREIPLGQLLVDAAKAGRSLI